MTHEQQVAHQLREEFRSAEERNSMSYDEFVQYRSLPSNEFAQLPPDVRGRYFSTLKYYKGEAQRVSLEGLTVGETRAEDLFNKPK